MSSSLEKAKAHLSAGEFVFAMGECEKAQKSNKDDWEAFHLRAVAIERLLPEWFANKLAEGSFDDELVKLPASTYEALHPSTVEALSAMVEAAKRKPESGTLGGRLVVSNMEANIARYQLARTMTLGLVQWAIDDLKAALRIKPDAEESSELLARLTALQDPKRHGGGAVGSTKTGCFIATAVYGSYDHPAVVAFRRFRDNQLIGCVVGRLVVAIYYRVSPAIARWLIRHPRQAQLVRNKVLNPLLMRLEAPRKD